MAALTGLSRRSSSPALSHFRFTVNRSSGSSPNPNHSNLNKTETPLKNTWQKFGDISGPLNSWPDYYGKYSGVSSVFGERGKREEMFPGCDYKHWLIIMNDFEERAKTKEEMLSRSVRTLAKVLGRDISGPLNSWPGYEKYSRPSVFGKREKREEMFPGCDCKHLLIIMDDFEERVNTKEEMLGRSVRTLAKVLGSEEEARKKIYNIFTDKYFGFGCQIDEETSNKLEDLPGVMFAVPDCYADAENKDYGAELVVNGEVVQREK